jgi:transcriptional regulator with XRE-family HTH domain
LPVRLYDFGVARIPHPLLKSIGQTIRALRRQRGLTQEALADLAHIDRSYMSSIERGQRNISVLNVARIAGALDVSLCHVLKGRSGSPDSAVRTRMHAFRARAGREWEEGCSLSLG